ncbi:hypothetical protein DWB77_07443 [Streptomyces hundungensis]|uniref:Uncharacterized protein n=1 Tax=Streptomyces hundungensis TaxID=1077946 RepID=A0A387HMS7_9ACTN|nr:hypothetical protein [Streptomyces hundungensis]AYG85226.1 hypothetical protein DWB77_07443 [Streptomyces hundungensis]
MNEEISRRLREAAESHQPDRAKMLARVERGVLGAPVRHRTPSIARSRPKAALAGLVTAGILATGGVAVAGIVGGPSPSDSAPAAPPSSAPSASPAPSATTRPTPSASAPTAGKTATPTTDPPQGAPAPRASSHPTPPPAGRAQQGPLWSQGSMGSHNNVYWAESDLTLRTAQPLDSLTVEVRIAQTGGVRNTGTWRTLPGDAFTATVEEAGGALVYRWVLKPGRTVPPGQHEFAAQYNHAPGARSTTADTYHVDAHAPGGPLAVQGGFPADTTGGGPPPTRR